MKKVKVLLPICLQDFVCIGPRCEFTCCQGWRIDIDDNTVKKYKKCKDEHWSKLFKKYLNKPTNKKGQYTISLDERGYCPFFTNEGLCSIQKKLGEEYLSIVCSVFPRVYNRTVKMQLEKTYYLSCPEVTKLVLFGKEKISFAVFEEQVEFDRVLINLHLKKEQRYVRSFEILRKFTIDVLQNRKYILEDRMLILTYFFESFAKQNNEIDIEVNIKIFEELINNNSIKEIIKSVSSDKTYYFSFLQDLLRSIYLYTSREDFRTYSEEIYNILGLNLEEEDTFFSLYDEYYRLFLQSNSFVLENYLVYSVYVNIFPFKSVNIWDDFMNLVLRYVLINFFVFGISVKAKGSFQEEELKRCFVIVSKVLDSSNPPSFFDVLLNQMKEKEEDNIFTVFKLLRL